MLILMCTSVFPEYILCTTHVPGASAGQRGFWISWTGIIDVLNHSVGVGNWTQVIWESSNAFTCKAISPSLRIITLTDIYFLYYLRQNVLIHHSASDILLLTQNSSLAMREHIAVFLRDRERFSTGFVF